MCKIDLNFNDETNKWEIEISYPEKTTTSFILKSFDTKDEAVQEFHQILESLYLF